MTLRFVNQSIVKSPEKVIAHGCNTKGVMGAGVALALKERWPVIFRHYEAAVVSGGAYLGLVNWVQVADEKHVANVMTQSNYGRDPNVRYASYDAIDKGLRGVIGEGRARGYLTEEDEVAIPMIGCSFGNASWDVVDPIIRKISLDLNASFVVYELDEAKIKKVTRAALVS